MNLFPNCSWGSSKTHGELEGKVEMEAMVVSDISCAFAISPGCCKYVTWTAFTHIVNQSND